MKDVFMKILHVVSSWKGGKVRVAFDVSEELIRRGHAVTIYATNLLEENKDLHGKKITTVTNFDVLFPSIAKKMKLYITPQLILTLTEIKHFDIIHLHGYRTFQNIVLHHYAKKCNIPYILQAHGSILRRGKQELKAFYDALFGYRLLKDASKVVALSRVEAQQYKAMGVPEEKIAIIPNGIDLSEYAELPPKGAFKKKFNIPEDKKIILYVGRIHKIKGIDFLVKAYAYLINKMNFRDAILVIAGPDDGYLGEVKSLVHNLGALGSVILTGSLSERDKIKAYNDASIVAYLGPSEPYGLVSLEAAACKTPVIVAQGTPMAEVVNRGKFGYSIKYGDVASLAFALRNILNNEEFAKNLGRNGRIYILNNFDWSKIIEKYEQMYREVISGNA